MAAFDILEAHFQGTKQRNHHVVAAPALMVRKLTENLKDRFWPFDVDIRSLLISPDLLTYLASDEVDDLPLRLVRFAGADVV